MSRQILKPLKDIIKTAGVSGSSISYVNGETVFTGYCWGTDDNFLEINPVSGVSYYYDIIYSNTSPSHFYIGFERYDANKTRTENNSCSYVVNTTSAVTNGRAYGVIDLSKDCLGNTTKYIKLRILNAWDTSSNVSYIAKIKFLSLREASSITEPQLLNSGIVKADALREIDNFGIYKNGYIQSTDFIEY